MKKKLNKNNKTKKVLFTATVDGHILNFHLPYLKMFKENGYEVHVATNGDSTIPYCDKKHIVSFERSPFNVNNIKAIKRLKKVIDEEKFEIIHCHTPMGGVVTRLAAKKSRKDGTRVIYTAHGFHFYKGAPKLNWLLFYPIEKWLSRHTDTLITINEEDYILAKKKFKAKQTELVHGVGVDTEKFNFKISEEENDKLRKEIGVDKNDFVMICIGELNNNKNQIMQIEAVKELAKEHKNIKLILAGEGDKREFLEQKIEEYNLKDNVKLLGYRTDIPRLLTISNLALSTSKREGLPVNVIEALVCGIPVIGTNCRGTRDLINNGDNGYIIEIGDVVDLVERINIAKELAHITLNKEFTLEEIKKNMQKIYFKNKQNVFLLRSTSAINDSRVTKEARTLLKAGYNVKLLCWDRDGMAKDINYIESEYGNAELIKFNVRAQYGGGMKTLLKMARFQIWIYKVLKKNNNKCDFIHSCDLDTGIAATIISKKYNKKLIYDIFDYYIASHYVPYILSRIVEKIEIWVINNASATIICNDWRREQIKEAKPNQLEIVHNSPNIDYEEIKNKGNILKSNNDKIKVAYVGILQDGRLLKEIVDELKGHSEIEIHIGGFGRYEEYFKEISNNYDNVYFYGCMKYDDVLKLEAECDVLFATYDPKIKNHKYSAPNKLYESMALRKPIIVCNDTGIDKFVIENNIGCAINYNAREFLNVLESGILDECDKERMGALYSEYSWSVMEQKILKIYNS